MFNNQVGMTKKWALSTCILTPPIAHVYVTMCIRFCYLAFCLLCFVKKRIMSSVCDLMIIGSTCCLVILEGTWWRERMFLKEMMFIAKIRNMCILWDESSDVYSSHIYHSPYLSTMNRLIGLCHSAKIWKHLWCAFKNLMCLQILWQNILNP